MANTATVVTTYKNEAGTATVKSETLSGDTTINIERTQMDAGSSNIQFDVPITKANILAIGIGCSKSPAVNGVANPGKVKLTFKTNSSSSPTDSIIITPENGYGWTKNDLANPLKITADVTKFYLNAEAQTAPDVAAKFDFFLRVLVDSTPNLAD